MTQNDRETPVQNESKVDIDETEADDLNGKGSKTANENENEDQNDGKSDHKQNENDVDNVGGNVDDDGDTEGELEPSVKKTPPPSSSVGPAPGKARINKRQNYLLQFSPSPTSAHHGTLEIIFRRCIASILASRGISTNANAFDFISLLAEDYMNDLFSRLFRTSQVQRRQQPSLADLKLTMDHFNIRISDLEKELNVKSRYTDILNGLKIDPEQEPLQREQEPFFNSSVSNLKLLVPSNKERGSFIPPWMPPLPPDHTFMSTPQYSRYVTEPRELREKLVEEGRLAEMALRRLAGMDINEVDGGTVRIDADEEDIMIELDDMVGNKENNEPKSDNEAAEDVDMKPVGDENEPNSDHEHEHEHEQEHEPNSDHEHEHEAKHHQEHDDREMKEINEESDSAHSLKTNGNADAAQSHHKTVRFADTNPEEPKKAKPFSLKIKFPSKKVTHPSDIITDSRRKDILSYVKERMDIIDQRKEKNISKKRRQEEPITASNTSKKRRQEEPIGTNNTASNSTCSSTTIDDEFQKVLFAVSKRNKNNPSSTIPEQELVVWDSNRYVQL